MKKLILFGAGFYGKSTYYKLHDRFEILYFADNNPNMEGKELFGIPIILGNKIREVYTSDTDIIICTRSHASISTQLIGMGITDYYIMMEGFLYHTNSEDIMSPVEINKYAYLHKRQNEKNILFVQNSPCIRTHKIASMMNGEGYCVYLLYTLGLPENSNQEYMNIYKNIYTFSSASGITDFIENSDFDLIHSSNTPDILTALALMTSKPLVFDTHDMNGISGYDSIEDLTLEYIANVKSDGNIYTSDGVAEIAKKRFGIAGKEIFSLENMILEQEEIAEPYEKLSHIDGEIHCVYEGGIVGNNTENERFFENIWKKIADYGIHIHYYSQADPLYCKDLGKKNYYFHYEGNMGTKELVKEMTKYDCGLAVFNVTEKNKIFLETGTANKMYEYINAQLPVIVGEVQSYQKFVKRYGVGISLDITRNIKEQIENACKIRISPNFLEENNLTMKSRSKELAEFYERVKKKAVKDRIKGRAGY